MSAAPSSKKSKTCNANAEIEAVRQHLLSCQTVPKSSRALLVAFQALDQEQQRMERDLKLQRKFASTTKIDQESNNNNKIAHSDLPEESKPPNNTTTNQQEQDDDTDDLLMEWQDVTTPSQEQEDLAEEEAGSILGKLLSQEAISKMATHNTTVASPLGAIALALHAALCSDILGFKCTGIPPSKEASKGFAAPIRELPKSQLVPVKWDENSNATEQHPTIKLRYRKDGVGSTVLSVSLGQNDNQVHVQLAPSGGGASKESPLELSFPMDNHVNLSSLSKALQNNPRVVPALHYKALAVLLTNMCNTFDLGPVQEEDAPQGEPNAIPYVDTTIVPPPSHVMSHPTIVGGEHTSRRMYNEHEPPTMRVFQPDMRRPGDFSSDLLPASGGMTTMDPLSGGNLMGPNHPAFGGNNNSGIGIGGGGYGMRPRFDPFGPPNGPQDPNNNDDDNTLMDPRFRRPQQPPRRPPPGGLGDPNPDHERPPNNLSNNMFM